MSTETKQENGRQGRLPAEMKVDLETVVPTMPWKLREALELPFEPIDIKSGETQHDGFTPVYVEGTTVIRRLNDCFGQSYSFEVVRHEFLWQAGIVIAVVRLTAKYAVKIGGQTVLMESHREGVGQATLKTIGQTNVYRNPGDDLKAACTDGLKVAARLFGVGLALWENVAARQPKEEQPTLQDSGHAPPPTQQQATLGAHNFQVDAIIKYFEADCGVTRNDWMYHVGIKDLSQINAEFGAYLLSGQHPYTVHLAQLTGKSIHRLAAKDVR